MQILLIATLVASVLAAPAEVSPQTNGGGGGGPGSRVCRSASFSIPICCANDILGVICLNGDTPHETPQNVNNFKEICARVGQQAKCCVLPIAGQGVLCTNPF